MTFCSEHFPVATFATVDHFDAICHWSVLKIITNYYISNFIFLVFNIIKKLKVNTIKNKKTESLDLLSIIATNKLVLNFTHEIIFQAWTIQGIYTDTVKATGFDSILE